MQLIVISGRSGSGKSVALKALEDLGYYCVDNMPVALLPAFLVSEHKHNKIAVSIDIRNLPNSTNEIRRILNTLESKVDSHLFYLDADEKELVKRFSETRRLHPLSKDKLSLIQAIEKEAHILSPLRACADKVINTDKLSVHDLSEIIHHLVVGKRARNLTMVFESFGFKYGLSNDADYVFDVRFLPNPHWIPTLRPFTGLDEPVKEFLAKQKDVKAVAQQIISFFESWLPALSRNNRSYVTIGIGCTGGQHRSVYLAQALGEHFQQSGQDVQIRHRTLELKNRN